MHVTGRQWISARGMAARPHNPPTPRNRGFHACPGRLGGTLWLIHFRGLFTPFSPEHGMNGPVNTPRIMRRANEPGLCSVLLFAAAVSCCHAQSSSDCALPQSLQSHARADPFTAWDSAGTWFAQRKDLRCATEAYNRALQLRPRSWRTLYDLGVVEIAQMRYASAVLHLRRAVDLKPDSVDARNALGMALKDSGQFGEAEKQFREVLEADYNSV